MRPGSALRLSWVEIKPASKGRNDPASGSRIRPHEKRRHFSFEQARHQSVNAGLFEEKYHLSSADFGGLRVISTFAGRLCTVTADTIHETMIATMRHIKAPPGERQ